MSLRPHPSVTRALGVALASWMLLAGAAFAADTVTLKKDGSNQDVQVTSADYDGLYYAIQKAQSKYKWSEVQNVRFTGAAEFYRAQDALMAGKVADAEAALDKLAADTKLRPVVRQEVLYAQGQVARRLGNNDKAVAAWRELLKSFPKSRYLIATGSNLIELQLSAGDVTGAQKTLDDLGAAAKSAGIDAAAQAGFGLLRARIQFEQKKYADAQSSYSSVAAISGADGDVVRAAKLGVASCLQMQNKPADAERGFRALTLDAEAPNAVLAGAWNGLGDLALDAGTQKRDQDKLRDAVFCYLRGVVLYGPAQEESTDEHERALAGSAAAFQKIGELESDAERKKQNLARAKERLTQLQTQFPSSRWLKPNKKS